MADHAHSPADQEKDRLFVTVVVLGLALTLALGSWKDGAAAPAPHTRSLPAQSERVLRVREGANSTVEYSGLILDRGATIHVVQEGGNEVVFLRPDAKDLELLSAAKSKALASSAPAAAPAAAPAPSRPQGRTRSGIGFLVNLDGAGFRGRLEEHTDSISIDLLNGQTVEIPRRDVRWFKYGVSAPDQSYYAAYPTLPVKGFPGPGGNDERHSAAINEFTLGNWAKATRLYFDLHLAGRTDLDEDLARAARRWSESPTSMNEREAAVRGIGALARAHREDRLMERLYASALHKLGLDAATQGFPRQARELAKDLRELGADHAPKAQQIEEEVRRRFGDR